MLTTARLASDPVASALARIAARGVTVEPWLTDGQSDTAVAPHRPVLYLVDPSAPPPVRWGELEDWVRLPVDPEDLYVRADRLLRRAAVVGAVPIEVDADDVLHVGDHRTILSQLEARLLRLLLVRRGEMVSREEATAALWEGDPPDDPRAVDNRLKNLRQRLHGLPLGIRTVRGRGFVLEWDGAAALRDLVTETE
jgi:hypothetical protein